MFEEQATYLVEHVTSGKHVTTTSLHTSTMDFHNYYKVDLIDYRASVKAMVAGPCLYDHAAYIRSRRTQRHATGRRLWLGMRCRLVPCQFLDLGSRSRE